MAHHAAELTPPSSADCMTPGRPQPGFASPSLARFPAAPPTPQDSQASAFPSSPTSPPLVLPADGIRVATPITMMRVRKVSESNILGRSNANVAKTAAIGPKAGRDIRMQQWLSEIPAPVTPQERYLQGLDPSIDHPLHPRPLQVASRRHAIYLVNSADTSRDDDALSSQYMKLALDGSDKENDVYNENDNKNEQGSLAPGFVPHNGTEKQIMQGAAKKRQISEDNTGELLARKRTKMLDPVRRFSQRLTSSLALSSALDDDASRDGRSEDLSPEDAAKQSEQLYRFGSLSKQSKNSTRMSFPKRYYGTLRAQSSGTVRRMMSSKTSTLMLPPPKPQDSIGFWTEGRPDMIVNVAFIGDARVGKTALIRRLVHGTFPQNYVPSDVQEQTIRLTVNDIRVEFNLSEGGSARDPREPCILALGWFSVVVLCFDIGHHDSFQNLQKYRNEIAMYEENSVVVMAGLKKDARHRLPPLHLTFVEEPTQVTSEVGKEAAKKMRCAEYFECSSLSACEGVDDLFDYIVHSGVEFQRARDKKMARFRFENSVDKSMTKIANGVRNLFMFRGDRATA